MQLLSHVSRISLFVLIALGVTTSVTTPAQAAGEPLAVKGGAFVSVEENGTGTATIYQLADGSYILRLENLRVDNGPDLRVRVLAPDGTALDLGGLKGNRGNQNYALPADFDPAVYDSADIWCRTFNSRFVLAALVTPQ